MVDAAVKRIKSNFAVGSRSVRGVAVFETQCYCLDHAVDRSALLKDAYVPTINIENALWTNREAPICSTENSPESRQE